MVWTTEHKKQLGTWLISIVLLTASFSYVGFKLYDNKTYKVFHDGYLELGIENGTKYCSHCEREFYLRLYKYVPFNETDKSASVIISNKLYRDMIKVELFDEYTKEKLNIPFQIKYKSGVRWYDYPPSTADLTLSTSRKQFKIIADIPENTAVSGLIGIKITIVGKEISISEDPIWWINGNPINIDTIKRCLNYTIEENTNIIGKYNILINTTFCSDAPLNKSCIKNFNYRNVTDNQVVGNYIYLNNKTSCVFDGYSIGGKVINFTKYGWKTCTRDNFEICCESPHQSNQNGRCESGEGYVIFDIRNLNNSKNTVSNTKSIKNIQVEK